MGVVRINAQASEHTARVFEVMITLYLRINEGAVANAAQRAGKLPDVARFNGSADRKAFLVLQRRCA